jgi:CheY-like chemotaxis protein
MSPRKITCLLIDDDSDDQEIFAHVLRSLDVDVECVTTTDGKQAVDKIKNDTRFKPHFIFIDVNMPRMNGIDCLIEIKKISHVLDTPVYLYSTFADPGTVEAAKTAGAKDVLVKANTIAELRAMLSDIMASNDIYPPLAATS